jgi:rubredoxin
MGSYILMSDWKCKNCGYSGNPNWEPKKNQFVGKLIILVSLPIYLFTFIAEETWKALRKTLLNDRICPKCGTIDPYPGSS